MACKSCGSLTCYAATQAHQRIQQFLSEKLTDNYKIISQFLVSNRLKLNDDKTHFMVRTPSKARRQLDPNTSVSIVTPSMIIVPSPCEKLLGAYIHQDLKWNEHIQDKFDHILGIKTWCTENGWESGLLQE